jgi:hypothetical protein
VPTHEDLMWRHVVMDFFTAWLLMKASYPVNLVEASIPFTSKNPHARYFPDDLPKYMNCEKAGTKCIDYDGITKREVSRG